jgi:hypothetical protein
MSKPKNNVSDLLAAIKRQTPAPSISSVPKEEPIRSSVSAEEPAKKRAQPQYSGKKTPKSKLGKPVQFWFHDEDRKLVRELSAWLAGQGVRPSDSMVLRAALRYAKTGNEFLECYWQASRLDGRLKRD